MVDQMLSGMVLLTRSRAVQTKWAQAQDGLLFTFAVSVLPESLRYVCMGMVLCLDVVRSLQNQGS